MTFTEIHDFDQDRELHASDRPFRFGRWAVELSGADEFGRLRRHAGVYVVPDSVEPVGGKARVRVGAHAWGFDPAHYNYATGTAEERLARLANRLRRGVFVALRAEWDDSARKAVYRRLEVYGGWSDRYVFDLTPAEQADAEAVLAESRRAFPDGEPAPVIAAQEGEAFDPRFTPPDNDQ